MTLGVISVYLEKDQPLEPYLARIQHAVDPTDHIIIGGDVNAWSTWWGSIHENHRGAEYRGFLDEQGMHILNEGDTPTFEVYKQGRLCSSRVDVTACSEGVLGKIMHWRVDRELTSSDHNAITFSLLLDGPLEPPPLKGTRLYNTKRANWTKFSQTLSKAFADKNLTKTVVDEISSTEVRTHY